MKQSLALVFNWERNVKKTWTLKVWVYENGVKNWVKWFFYCFIYLIMLSFTLPYTSVHPANKEQASIKIRNYSLSSTNFAGRVCQFNRRHFCSVASYYALLRNQYTWLVDLNRHKVPYLRFSLFSQDVSIWKVVQISNFWTETRLKELNLSGPVYLN